jgi:hypothetical protein
MSIQKKIAGANIEVKKKLRNYSISINGVETGVIRLHVEEDDYGDETLTIIDTDEITVILDIPDDIPMDRLRPSESDPSMETDSLFLFDILPIEGYAKFTDEIEKGDILIRQIYDEVNSTPFLMVLRVSEIIGTVVHNYVTHRKFQCAPYSLTLTSEMQETVNSYLS